MFIFVCVLVLKGVNLVKGKLLWSLRKVLPFNRVIS